MPVQLPYPSSSQRTITVDIWPVSDRLSLVDGGSNGLCKYWMEVLPRMHHRYIGGGRCDLVEVSRGEIILYRHLSAGD